LHEAVVNVLRLRASGGAVLDRLAPRRIERRPARVQRDLLLDVRSGGQDGRAGELAGVTFDGNLESLPNIYLYTDEQARAVHVSAQGIAEALVKVYKAEALLRELGISR
jgi:hypothetical protein